MLSIYYIHLQPITVKSSRPTPGCIAKAISVLDILTIPRILFRLWQPVCAKNIAHTARSSNVMSALMFGSPYLIDSDPISLFKCIQLYVQDLMSTGLNN